MISKLLDHMSEYLAHRKGLLPLAGILLIMLNLMVQFVFPSGWLAASNLFLHVGLVVAIFGLMLAWAL
jgi:hypothetical protein